MKRVLTALFVLALMLFLVGVPQVQARPMTTDDCTSYCDSLVKWTGPAAHGEQMRVQINNPGFSNNYTNAYFLQSLLVENANWPGHPSVIEMGIEKDRTYNSNGICSGFSPVNTLYWFYNIVNNNLGTAASNCFAVDPNDFNTTMYLEIGYFATGGPGFFVNFDDDRHDISYCSANGPFHAACYFNSSQYNIDTSYNTAVLQNAIQDYVTGHQQWGADWGYNQYASITAGWQYQNVPSSCNGGTSGGCPYANNPNPVQMYWKIYPANSTHGGDLYSCIYDHSSFENNTPANSCTIAH